MSQRSPSINELLLAVQSFVKECTPMLEGQARYRALSASYVLGVCERELRLGQTFEHAEVADLTALVGHSGTAAQLRAELCAQIRAGKHDENWQQVLNSVLEHVANEVRIVKPEHLAEHYRGDEVTK